jgi:hypothetical protein
MPDRIITEATSSRIIATSWELIPLILNGRMLPLFAASIGARISTLSI